MGLTYARIAVSGLHGGPSRAVSLLVDTGSHYLMLPRKLLRELGVRPVRREEFELANGRKILRDVGIVFLRFRKRLTASDVIFGGPRDSQVLGVIALEQLGYQVDPVHHRLRKAKRLLVVARAT